MTTGDKRKETPGASVVDSSDWLEAVGVWLIGESEYWCATCESQAIEGYKQSYKLRITDKVERELADDHPYLDENETKLSTMAEEAIGRVKAGQAIPFCVAVSFDAL